MSDWLLSAGASNFALSTLLALVAWIVHARARRPWLAHLLWLLVLAKLVTPPIVSAPVITIPADQRIERSGLELRRLEPVVRAPLGLIEQGGHAASDPSAGVSAPATASILAGLWLVGSAVALAISLVRVARFDRRIRRSSRPAGARLERMAVSVSARLGLRRVPDVRLVDANLAPLVWWVGGGVRVVLPSSMVAGLEQRALRLVLAHELAHVRRHDHLVRWVEWAAGVLFWWNPILWIARRGLRASEEICCDSLVVERLSTSPTSYASSLLDAIELLAAPALRPPVMASRMNSGVTLEHRLTMIISNYSLFSPPRWTRAIVLCLTAVVLPIGIAVAQAPAYEAVTARLVEAVEAGELTESQAKAMFGALAEQHLAESLAARRPGGDAGGGRLAKKDARLRRYHEVQRSIDAAVRRGELTRDAAERRRVEMRIEIFEDANPPGQEAGRRRYREVAAELKAMVEAGRLSREDADLRLEGLRRELFGENDGRGGPEADARLRRYHEIERAIDAELERGEITDEEAERRRIEMRGEIFGDPKRAGQEAGRRRYEEAAAELKLMVEAGRLSREDAGQRLEALEREMFGEQGVGRDDQAMRAGIESRLEEVRAMHERGELSREEFGRILRELEGAMGEPESVYADSEELGAAVRHLEEEIVALDALIRSGSAEEGLVGLYRQGLLGHDLPRLEKLGADEQTIAGLREGIEGAGSGEKPDEEREER